MLYLDTTMLRKFENESKNQNKKNLRLKIYGKIRNGRLKLEPNVLIKNVYLPPFEHDLQLRACLHAFVDITEYGFTQYQCIDCFLL